jgi:hypothetical protein
MIMRTRSSRSMMKKKKDHHLLCQIETTSGTPSLQWNRWAEGCCQRKDTLKEAHASVPVVPDCSMGKITAAFVCTVFPNYIYNCHDGCFGPGGSKVAFHSK